MLELDGAHKLTATVTREAGNPPVLQLPEAHKLKATVSRGAGAPPVLQLPKAYKLTATVSREAGDPPLLELPEAHALTATVSRKEFLVVGPDDTTCQFGISEDGTCNPEDDRLVCPFGVSSKGECLPGEDGLVCPFGVDDLGQCVAGPGGELCPFGVSEEGCLAEPMDTSCGEGASDGEQCEDAVDQKQQEESKQFLVGGYFDLFAYLMTGHGIAGNVDIESVELGQVHAVDGNNPFDPDDPLSPGETGGPGSTGGGGFDFNLLVTPPGYFLRTTTVGGTSCGIESTYVDFNGSILSLSYFYGNNPTTFAASFNFALSQSSNLTILGQPGHVCTLTPTDANTFTILCRNTTTNATCSDVWTRQ